MDNTNTVYTALNERVSLSPAAIANRTGVSERTVRRELNSLLRGGLVVRRQSGADKRKKFWKKLQMELFK